MSKEERNHPAFEFGSDLQFLHWTSLQPSILDGTFNQYNPDRNIACHVRRVKFGSGIAHKPKFCAVPMTDRQHKISDEKDGLIRVIKIYRNLTLSLEEAEKWFEDAKDENLAAWIEHRKSKRFDISGLQY